MSSDVIRLDVPAAHKYLNVVCACAAEMLARLPDLPDAETTIYNVQLALQEACANIVNHAYSDTPGRIGITFTLDTRPRRLHIELHDTGRAFDPEAVPQPDLNNSQVHGYGLFLMRQLMDEVTYHPRPGGNRWLLVKNL